MRLKRFVLLLIVGCLLTLTASTVFAQLDLDETFIADDDSFEFMYPSDWEVNTDSFEESGFVALFGSVGRNDISMIFFGPEMVGINADSLEEVVEDLGSDFNFDNETDLEIDDRSAIATTFELGDNSGLAITIEMEDGGFGLILIFASADTIDRTSEEIVQIVATFDSVGGNGGRGNGGISNILGTRGGDDDDDEDSESIDSLSDHDSENWRDAIAELEDKGLIGSGGLLIFNENRAFFDGMGSWFTPLARNTSRRDVVMAAELKFNTDSREFESCSLLARIDSGNGGTVSTFLEVGIDNDGDVFWIDREDDDIESGLAPLGLDLDDTHHLLFLALDDALTVYVNGEIVFDNIRIQSRSGSFGIALVGRGPDSLCEGSNIWAYDAPVFIPGLCEVTSGGTVNKRSGPGTNFDRAGTLAGGERLQVVGQAEDGSDFIWYELEDDSWVREDVVSLLGDCGDIPDS